MGILNSIGKKTSETTNRIAKETKLKLKINENKGRISDLYEELGKKVYEKHILEESVEIAEDIGLECDKIDSLAAEIEIARMELLELKQRKQCKNCYNEMQAEDMYCPKCGKKQIEEEATVFEEALEKIEESEIKPKNTKKAKIVKEKLEEKVEEQE